MSAATGRAARVPAGPVISTLAFVSATRVAVFWSRFIAGDSPQYISPCLPLPPVILSRCRYAICNTSISLRLSHGFTMKSNAPSFIAFTASSTSAYAVNSTTGTFGKLRFVSCSQKIPSFPLLMPETKFMSRSTTSILFFCIDCSILDGDDRTETSLNMLSSSSLREVRIFVLSSTINMLPCFFILQI